MGQKFGNEESTESPVNSVKTSHLKHSKYQNWTIFQDIYTNSEHIEQTIFFHRYISLFGKKTKISLDTFLWKIICVDYFPTFPKFPKVLRSRIAFL